MYITNHIKTIFLLSLGIIVSLQSASAIIYLDDIAGWDINDSQNIVFDSDDTQVPASEPIVLMDGSDLIEDGSKDVEVDLDTLIDPDIGNTSDTGIILESNNSFEDETTIADMDINLDLLIGLDGLDRDAEFLISLKWLYDSGLTKYNKSTDYQAGYYLTRVDAAKMLSILSEKVFDRVQRNDDVCSYTDVIEYDDVTKGQIKNACKLGIFRSAMLFNPNQGITKGQLIVVLIRMYDGSMYDEASDPRYTNYVARAYQIGLLSSRSSAGMDEIITRGDVAKLLYKLRNIYLNQSPSGQKDLPFIYKVADFDDNTITALIDINLLRDDDIDTLEMGLGDTTYYFVKSQISNYGTTLGNFQVYGYIYDSEASITPIGVGTWRVQKGIIQEGIIDVWGDTSTDYSIRPMSYGKLYRVNKITP